MSKYIPYSEKLKDSRWQKKRLELLEKAKWKCQNDQCPNESENPNLQVHHKIYLKSTDPWTYEDWCYEVLCDECHKQAQDRMKSSDIIRAMCPSISDLLSGIRDEIVEGKYSERDVERFFWLLTELGVGFGGQLVEITQILHCIFDLTINARIEGFRNGEKSAKKFN